VKFILAAALLILMACRTCPVSAADAKSPRDGWDFAFRDFVIGAWNPPGDNDAEYKLYREAGFNLVMSCRYVLPDKALDLAQKYGLRVMVDTYTPHDKPWGGTAGKYTPHPSHHPATLPELKWLHERYGQHQALAGYLLGDDYGALPPELVETTAFLRDNAPRLFPWVCQNVMSAESLAKAGNPIQDPQIYPTLYQKDWPAEEQAVEFCRQLEHLRQGCRKQDLIPWPMFNVCGLESDSLLRFQVYASLAYGAQGLWYFTYRDGLVNGAGYTTEEQVGAHMLPIWRDAQAANKRVAAWGERLLGKRCIGVFDSGAMPGRSAVSGDGKLIERMSGDLLVGVLSPRPGGATALPLVMVVDKRVDKRRGALPEREIEVRFARQVTSTQVIEGGATRGVPGNVVRLKLPAGGGQLLQLVGRDLAPLFAALENGSAAPAGNRKIGSDGLILALDFAEGKGELAHDASGALNHVWLRNVGWVPGRGKGGAVHFDGKLSHGQLTDAYLPTTDAMSVSVWVRPHYSDKAYGPVVLIGPGGIDRFEFGFGPDNLYPVIADGLNHSGATLYVNGMRNLIPQDTWGHIAVCAGPQGAVTYINGKAVAKSDFVGRFEFALKDLQLGVRGDERYEGDLAEARAWNRCLSAEEVAALASK
jgi:hypothetical protein